MGDLKPRWSETESLLALRAATNAAVRVRPVVAHAAHLSHSELVALEHLMRGPVGPAELARLLEVTTAASTGIVDRLEHRGHVTRVADATDRRRTSVHLTDSGRAEVLALLMPMFQALQALDDGFDDQERAVVARYLRGATAAFEAVTGPRPRPREPMASQPPPSRGSAVERPPSEDPG
jgi:DNA-binding MarR family transcriptional regulator